MEIAILAGMGIAGFFLGNDENTIQQNIPKYQDTLAPMLKTSQNNVENNLENNVRNGVHNNFLKSKTNQLNYGSEMDDSCNHKKILKNCSNKRSTTINKKPKHIQSRSNFQLLPDDNNILTTSENITNNTDSINRILGHIVNPNRDGNCEINTGLKTTDKNINFLNRDYDRAQRIIDLQRNAELIGDYRIGSEILDDDHANFPNINSSLAGPRSQAINDEPAYLSQFDAQTFDASGAPGASNDIYGTSDKSRLANLERKISYTGGWSQYNQGGSMSYGIVPDDQLVHDNMVPFYSIKAGYGSNDLHSESLMDRKNETFTGNFKDTWTKKREVNRFFVPEKDVSYPFGTPIYSEEELTYYFPSIYQQKAKPFDDVKVTPGLNLDHDEVGTHGFHSMVRIFDPGVDQLRTRPRVTYEGRMIDGMHGQARPLQAPVIKYRPDTFKVTTEDDLLPSKSTMQAPRIKENFIMKETDRSSQNVEYTGGAYTSQEAIGKNVPEHMREKYKESTKQNFTLPKPLQKFSKDEAIFNPNINSYNLPCTARDQTIHNTHIGNAAGESISYTSPMDNAKTTIRETTSDQPQVMTNVISNTMRGTVYPMDIAKATIKETIVDNPLNPKAPSLNTTQRVYNSDIARTTIRETTDGPIAPSNPSDKTTVYANWTDPAKATIKETTVSMPRHTTITPVNQQQRAPNPQDEARTTIKQTTVGIPYQTNVTPVNQQQGSIMPQDSARTTIRQITVDTPYQTMIAPVGQQQGNVGSQDIARTTVRETTVGKTHQTFTTPINQQQRAPNPQDRARTTIRETTVNIPYQTMVTPINQQQRAPDFQDTAKPTIRETTVQTPWNTFVTPVNQQQRGPDPQDIAKTTIRETTVQTPWNTFTTPVNQQQRAPNPQDSARTTIRETTVNIPYQTMVTPINQQQRAPDFQDTAKPTIRETTVQTPWNTFTTPVNQQQRAPDPQDTARMTIRETTVGIPYQTVVTPVGQQQRAPDSQDIAKPTIRETTVGIPYQTVVTPIGQQQRAPDFQDTAKPTIRETTTGIPRQTIITPIGQQQRAPNSQDIARPTIKETTTGIPRQTIVTPIGQQQRAPDLQDMAKTTIRETTVGIPYQTVITPVGQHQRAPNLQDTARTTIRETTVNVPYNTINTGINQTQGRASAFDRTPLRTTTKESTVGIPYNTHVVAVGQYQRTPNPQDVAKTTIKETIVDIPQNNVVTAINQTTGKVSSFNRLPTKTTIKETTIDNNHVGMATQDVYGKGYGYMAENMFAPNTNKQFTCQEVYIAPLKGETRSRTYDDMYNARIDDRKEKLHWYRPPTASGINIGPDPNKINIQVRNDNNIAPEPILGYSVNNNLDRLKSNTTIKSTGTVSGDRFIDPILLKQLQTNPFSLPSLSCK